MLRESPLAAGQIATRFDLNRPAVSEHLNVLREARLVVEEVRGRHRIYHLNGVALAEVSEWLHPFEHYWRQRVDVLVDFLDKEEKSDG